MKFFTQHPQSVGESYLEHLQMAFGFGSAMVIGGLACILHGLLPALFVTTGSQTVSRLHQSMVTKRRSKPHTGLQAHRDTLDFVI